MTAAPVRLEREDGLAIVTLDSPPLNLFDDAVIESLVAAVGALEEDPPRAVLFRAQGKVVTGGVDVHVFQRIVEAGGRRGGGMMGNLVGLVQRVEALPCPTVFAAHALCLTAGFELALGCDLLLAAEAARFGLVEIVVGLTPGMGGTQRLAERAGPARARELVMTGELYDATTLERWNVVNRVLPDEGFAETAHAFAARLAAGPTRANAATKRVVRAYLEGGVAQADAEVPEISNALFQTEDLQNAVRSFLEHGPGQATFTGR